MGKKPIVVNDCPGFLVNRVLSPYIGAFMGLVRRGVDFTLIDRAMERFGWPMGPAYLCDVVGIDTGVHAGAVMAEGFPDRMKYDFKTCHEVMFENERFGQKNGRGYYAYETDKKGRPKKVIDEEVATLLAPIIDGDETLGNEAIVDSMMIPMCLEAVRRHWFPAVPRRRTALHRRLRHRQIRCQGRRACSGSGAAQSHVLTHRQTA
jgi:3-hydroxyacyl-CoA dehydrogenase/enoyl-CoA hydratase/3-hydroxybutyryl-CoA epimerase/enoyl-CoA isomerase